MGTTHRSTITFMIQPAATPPLWEASFLSMGIQPGPIWGKDAMAPEQLGRQSTKE
jgi:hypothetical protein